MSKRQWPRVLFDLGTGYELFACLFVIHKAADYGVRPSWAAGVRSRLSADVREMLANIIDCFGLPAHWVYALAEPRDGAAVIQEIERMPAETILPELALDPGYPQPIKEIFFRVMKSGTWGKQELKDVMGFFKQYDMGSRKNFQLWLDWWTKPGEFGLLYRRGLQEFYEGFFREEEKRIRPVLEEGLERVRKRSRELSVPDLFDEITQAHWMSEENLSGLEDFILIPSFWISPLVFIGKLNEKQGIAQFGIRPKHISLVPGEAIPEGLSLPLQALSDTTRLRILRLLNEDPLTQAQIAKALRLRAPTITHHIKILRFANLIVPAPCDSGEKRYRMREQSMAETWEVLEDFLKIGRNGQGGSENGKL